MKKNVFFITFLVSLVISITSYGQAHSFVAGNLNYFENFDGLGPDGTTYLTGWQGVRAAGTGTIGEALPLKVTDGSANTGAVYNVGTTGSTERAMGTIGSNSTSPAFGANFTNSTGSTITKIDFSGFCEQWRTGTNSSVNEVHKFEVSFNATDLLTGTWTEVSDFNLIEIVTNSTQSEALDGNAAENRQAINATLENIEWLTGTDMWIRWTDDNAVGSDALLAIDELKIDVSTGSTTILPEPSNYPTNLAVQVKGFDVTVTWTDAVGEQLPTGYLVMFSSGNINVPTDGNFVANDLDFSDNNGAINVAYGVETCTFADLNESLPFKVAIFPYTNGGPNVDYKTDGNYPTIISKTQTIVFSEDFEEGMDDWTTYNELGSQVWTLDPIHGIDNSACAKMSGYEGAPFANIDWLISREISIPIGFKDNPDIHLRFFSAKNFAGENIKVLYSIDYISGDPNLATWVDITDQANLSTGSWNWTNSSFIAIPENVWNRLRIAFKYTSTDTQAATWEIDDVCVTSYIIVGVPKTEVSNIKVYPNPATNYIFVENAKPNTMYKIADMQGKTVKAGSLSDTKIDVSNLNKGLYVIMLTDPKTGYTETAKVVIR
ncbi:MAG: choice-of-anchor J domain-containing protein [Lentimicrobiaceae bacterium]|nr:choice-of-anchor J domain-containing protein [Lentimicrobiaceae bacterium]